MKFSIEYQAINPKREGVGRIGVVPWDSETFGFNVGDIVLEQYAYGAEDFKGLIEEWSERLELGLIGARVAAEDIAMISFLQRAGFVFVDATLGLVYENLREDRLPRVKSAIDETVEGDLPQLKAIAGQVFDFGRYHADLLFPRELADKRYADWVERAAGAGSAQAIYVGRSEDEIKGFSVIEIKGDGTGHYHLLAIAKPWQASTFAAGMLGATLRHFIAQGVKTVRSRISLPHTRVMNLHAYFGAKFLEPEMIMHWHNPKRPWRTCEDKR